MPGFSEKPGIWNGELGHYRIIQELTSANSSDSCHCLPQLLEIEIQKCKT